MRHLIKIYREWLDAEKPNFISKKEANERLASGNIVIPVNIKAMEIIANYGIK